MIKPIFGANQNYMHTQQTTTSAKRGNKLLRGIYATLTSLLVFTLVQSTSYAQVIKPSKEFSYTVSQPYKVVDGLKYYFSKNGEVLAIKYSKGQWIFQKFSGGKFNETKRFAEPKSKEKYQIETFITINDRIYFFYSIYDRTSIQEQLFVKEVDFENAKFKDQGKLLFKVNGKVSGSLVSTGFGFGFTKVNKFQFYTDFDEKKLAVKYRMVPEVKQDALNKDKIGLHVFDEDMQELWSDIVTMPYTEKKMNNIDYAIDSDGNAYILAEIFRDNTTARVLRNGDINYDIELIRIDKDDQSVTNTRIEGNDKFIDDIAFFEGQDNELILAGYYKKTPRSGVEGFFLQKITNEGQLLDEVAYNFPADIVKQYMTERQQRSVEKKEDNDALTINNLKLRNVIVNADGSITLIGEKYYFVTRCDSKGRCTTTFYYQEMLAASVSAEGELQWMQKLPKNQVGSSGQGGMGFYYMSSSKYHYLLFLDNIKNYNLALNKIPERHSDGRGGFLTGYKVDKLSGKTSRISIFDTRNAQGTALYQFATDRIIQVGDNAFVLECYIKGKNDVMIKVVLKD
jgi:hypothetical protein